MDANGLSSGALTQRLDRLVESLKETRKILSLIYPPQAEPDRDIDTNGEDDSGWEDGTDHEDGA